MAQVPPGQSTEFQKRMAELKERASGQSAGEHPPAAAQQTRPRAMQSTSNTVYFHYSHKTLTILDENDQKIKIENHFLVTDNKNLAEHIRKNYVNKKGGSIVIREVNHFYYEQSHMIQPVIEPLPAMQEDPVFPPEAKPLQPDLVKSDPNKQSA